MPYYIRMAYGSPMPFAGIWEEWCSPEGQVLEICAILTTTANATVAKLHDRMPVILHPDEFGPWLDRQVHGGEKLSGLSAPYPASRGVPGAQFRGHHTGYRCADSRGGQM